VTEEGGFTMAEDAPDGVVGAPSAPTAVGDHHIHKDIEDLHQFGYQQRLRRTMGAYTSFALGFSMITITTTIFTLFAQPFQTIGGVAIWLWIPVTLGILVITLVYGHLSARLPVTGYAYQWSSRIVNVSYGWFSGWTALLSFMAGTASIAVAMASVFAPEFWSAPTHFDIALFAAIAIIAAVVLNIISIRAATWFNNVGASAELIGTLGLTAILAVGLFFFADKQGPSVLTQVGSATGGPINITTVGLAMLLPVYTLLGWEGSADLAEETRDPRKTAPTAMFRSVIISGVAAFFVYAVFAMAIPGSIAETVNQTGNPLIYVFQYHFGSGLALVLKIVAFVAIFSALLANVTVATRMCFSLARDNMLPGSSALKKVNHRTRTPIYSILLIGAVALIINALSAGLIARVVAIVAVTYYGTYVFTLVATLIGSHRGTIPDAPARYFNLGRWLKPLAYIGIAWSIVIILYMTVPQVNNVAGEYTLYFEIAGVIWFFAYLRRRLKEGKAGPPLTDVVTGGISEDENQIAKESL
jgi:amino acid transporter